MNIKRTLAAAATALLAWTSPTDAGTKAAPVFPIIDAYSPVSVGLYSYKSSSNDGEVRVQIVLPHHEAYLFMTRLLEAASKTSGNVDYLFLGDDGFAEASRCNWKNCSNILAETIAVSRRGAAVHLTDPSLRIVQASFASDRSRIASFGILCSLPAYTDREPLRFTPHGKKMTTRYTLTASCRYVDDGAMPS